jgi:hypothetical protein
MKRWTRAAVVALSATAMATGIEALGAVAAPARGWADVCGSIGGRHVSVSGCGNVADAIAPWVPPPSEYAPLPEDYETAAPPPPPPPPPPPNISVCANVGRRISVSGCI